MLLPDATVGTPAASPTEALPVRLHLRGPDAAAVERWVLAVGWQPVGEDPLVRPALVVADVPAVLEAPTDQAATILLVADDPPVAAAVAAAAGAVAEVVGWPHDRDRLPEVAQRVVARQGTEHVEALRVAGGSGGTGTTTVALALAGLCAWAGRATLALRAGRAGPDGEELDGVAAWRAATPVPGLRALRTLEVPDPTVTIGGGPARLVVRDLGVDADTDVLVVRHDRAGLEAVQATTAAVIVAAEVGPAPAGALRDAAGGRRVVTVPWSARVERAGLRGRVPAGIPGSWLRRVAPVLGRGSHR